MFPLLFAVSSVGGVAGGIIFIPIAISLLQMSTKGAISSAAAIVFESALIRFVFFSAYAKHPTRENATEIDYNLVRIVYPAFLVGSFCGALFSVSLGELWLAILLTLILIYLTFNVFRKATNLYRKETQQFEKEASEAKVAESKTEEAKAPETNAESKKTATNEQPN